MARPQRIHTIAKSGDMAAPKDRDRHMKPQLNIRPSEEARALLERIQQRFRIDMRIPGLSLTEVIEILIRDKASELGFLKTKTK